MTLKRLGAVAGLADDLDAAHLAEQEAQLLARQLLVVDDHRSQRRCRSRLGAGSSPARRARESRYARTCPAGTLSSWSW